MASAQSRIQAWVWALSLAAVVVSLDQITKQLAVSNVERGQPIDVLFGFELANLRNKGVAFGLLSGGETLVLACTLGALAVLLLYFAIHADRPGLWVSVGLVAGGALGNLADRLRIGAVIDFLDPPLWPAFNAADAAIISGVALLALILLAPQEGDGDHEKA
jgi:signal peptidase II